MLRWVSAILVPFAENIGEIVFLSTRFIANSSLPAKLIGARQTCGCGVYCSRERGPDVEAIQDKHYRQQPTMAAPNNGSVELARVVPCSGTVSCGMYASVR